MHGGANPEAGPFLSPPCLNAEFSDFLVLQLRKQHAQKIKGLQGKSGTQMEGKFF